jgi:hypothetical protein
MDALWLEIAGSIQGSTLNTKQTLPPIVKYQPEVLKVLCKLVLVGSGQSPFLTLAAPVVAIG